MKKINCSLFIVLLFVFFSCSTDIEVNAPEEDITVVYAMINPADSIHYVKINKAFIGAESAIDLAANSDNFNYKDSELEVTIEEYSGETWVKAHVLTRTEDEVIKSEGVFDNTGNVLYKFIEPAINESNTYKLKVVNKVLDKVVRAETDIVNNYKSGGSVRGFTFWTGRQYATQEISLVVGNNVGRVEAILNFNYTEHYTTASGLPPVDKTITMSLGEKEATSSAVTQLLEWEMKGENFYQKVEDAVALPSDVPFFSHRLVNDMSIDYKIAGTELSTFMKVAAPSNSVNQDKPAYTNVENGIGIFSSRTTMIEVPADVSPSFAVNVTSNTIDKLASLGLGFCFGASSTSTFKCTQL